VAARLDAKRKTIYSNPMRSLIQLIRKTYKMANHHERKSILSNAAYLTALQAVTYVLPIIIIPYLFRVIGPEKFGLLALAQAFTLYFVIITDYGLNISATRTISLCGNNNKTLSQAFAAVMSIKMILGISSILLASIIIFLVPRLRSDWPIYILNLGFIVGNIFFPMWFFQGREKMKYITALNVTFAILSAIAIFSFVRNPQDYLLVPLINSWSNILLGICGQYMAMTRFKIYFTLPPWQEIRAQFKNGWHVFISIASINIYTATRVFVLGLFTNNTITGFYSIAETIANACQTFPLTSFTQAIFPRLNKIRATNRAKAWTMMLHLQQITTVIALVALPIIGFFADKAVKIVCGAVYPQAVVALQLLLIGVFFVAANAFKVQFLIVCEEFEAYSKIHIQAACLGLPLIIFGVITRSFIGAACASVLVEIFVFIATHKKLKSLAPLASSQRLKFIL
jgi:PST family polysaccharide transporter